MILVPRIIDELEHDIEVFEEKLNVVKAYRNLLAQNNHDIKFLTKQNKELITQNECLKAELRDVAEQLRAGISKVQQKTLARAIEENLKEFK